MADNKPNQTQDQGAGASSSNDAQPATKATPKKASRKAREKPLPALHPTRMQSVEYVRNVWIIHPEVGTDPEELLAPDYWAAVANQLRQRDRIEAWAEDLSWYAEYLVLSVGRNWAKVHLCERTVEQLRAFEPRRAGMILPGHTIEYSGLVHKWRVKRDKDGIPLKTGCETEGEALSWLSEHAKSLST